MVKFSKDIKRGYIDIKNLCLECSKEIRGLCCCLNMVIGKYNIVLDNVCCPFLDLKTMKCKDYKNRRKNASWCLNEKEMFNLGALPKGCVYLKNHPERESNPKQKITDIIKDLPLKEAQPIVDLYNFYNNIPFMNYVNYLVKIEV